MERSNEQVIEELWEIPYMVISNHSPLHTETWNWKAAIKTHCCLFLKQSAFSWSKSNFTWKCARTYYLTLLMGVSCSASKTSLTPPLASSFIERDRDGAIRVAQFLRPTNTIVPVMRTGQVRRALACACTNIEQSTYIHVCTYTLLFNAILWSCSSGTD